MMCIFGGFLFVMLSVKPTFDKPYRSVPEQLARLEERRLCIDIARSDALRILESITYYRFAGYALAFLGPNDAYTGDLRFSDVLALYRFDARLRGLLVSALSAVEVTFRAMNGAVGSVGISGRCLPSSPGACAATSISPKTRKLRRCGSSPVCALN